MAIQEVSHLTVTVWLKSGAVITSTVFDIGWAHSDWADALNEDCILIMQKITGGPIFVRSTEVASVELTPMDTMSSVQVKSESIE